MLYYLHFMGSELKLNFEEGIQNCCSFRIALLVNFF